MGTNMGTNVNNANRRSYKRDVVDEALKAFSSNQKNYRRCIKEHNLTIPEDMDISGYLQESIIEPDFLDNLIKDYPEYFI